MPTESRIRVAQTLHAVFGQQSRVPETWNAGLEPENAAFAQALLGLCLRRWGRLQAHVDTKLADPERGIPLGTQVCLAIGLAQLAWLPGVSDHAAVHESVEMAADRTLGFPPHKGMVNAILRAAARNRSSLANLLDELPHALDRTPFVERVLQAALAPRHQEPQIEALWNKLQEPPAPCFLAVTKNALPEGLEEDPDLAGCLRLAPGASFPRKWLEEGSGMVQDRSSQALMAFPWDNPVKRVVDLCAAPGGKTTALALRWPHAQLFAIEQHPRRARRLQENLQARKIPAEVVVDEASAWLSKSTSPFDVILLDAPCSGSGTIRKHPELTWLGDTLDLDRLQATQRTLLQSAAQHLAPGGLLLYSVCSWLPEEGTAHLLWVQEHVPELHPVSLWPARFSPEPGCFCPDPLDWEGEGFQALALGRPE